MPFLAPHPANWDAGDSPDHFLAGADTVSSNSADLWLTGPVGNPGPSAIMGYDGEETAGKPRQELDADKT